jgi:hypothetical protein
VLATPSACAACTSRASRRFGACASELRDVARARIGVDLPPAAPLQCEEQAIQMGESGERTRTRVAKLTE